MQTQIDGTIPHELVEDCQQFLVDYYEDDIGALAQSWPQEQRALTIAHSDLYQYDMDLADDYLTHPSHIQAAFEDALGRVELPIDVDLSDAHVRVIDLPDRATFYPGEFSPSDHDGHLRAIRGEIAKATDVYSRLQLVTFCCERCGTRHDLPQLADDWQEPNQCKQCEREGPFTIDHEDSEAIDAQKLRLQTPPEEAQGDGQEIDVFVDDDLAGQVTAGDRVTVVGEVELEQEYQGSQPLNKFEPFVTAHSLQVEETDAEDIDISSDQRDRIEALVNGEHGNPLELAANSLAPKIYGYEDAKKAIILALVGGARTEYAGQDFDRGEFHILLIGDPSTAKSKLVERAEQIGWRSVGVSGSGATTAGVTATAVQDDFGDGSWTLDAGAAVKANRGVLAVDELDDMPAEVRSALLEPMSKQTIHITKGGINTHLQTRCAVVAAANPEHGRFDPYEPIGDQFVFSSTLLSRFDLVYTFKDEPDPDDDQAIADHILQARDAAKRLERGEDVSDEADPRPPVDPDTLRAWIALAKQQPKPVFASDAVRDYIADSFTDLRGMHGYDSDDPIPVTFRSLEGIVRVAEAAARFEFADTIEERHVEIATDLVGASMRDVGKDPETDQYDADMVETGTSKSQRDRMKNLTSILQELTAEYDDTIPEDVVVDRAEEAGIDASKARKEIDNLKQKGEVIEPDGPGEGLRYIGGV